jgi:hypothetical protein
MVAHVNRLAFCLSAISIFVLPATARALPFLVGVQPVEISFELMDDPNGTSDFAGRGAFNGLVSVAESWLGGGMAGGAGGSGGGAPGGGMAQSGRTRVQASTPRTRSSNSIRTRSVGSGYGSGGGPWFYSSALVPLMVVPLPETKPTEQVAERVPEAATVLYGGAVALFLFRRRRSGAQ